jgi:hypothetical protein
LTPNNAITVKGIIEENVTCPVFERRGMTGQKGDLMHELPELCLQEMKLVRWVW